MSTFKLSVDGVVLWMESFFLLSGLDVAVLSRILRLSLACYKDKKKIYYILCNLYQIVL